MYKRIAIVIAVFLAIFLVGCAPSTNSNSNTADNKPIVAVSENWSYINFNDMWGSPNDNKDAIGNAILQWEQSHPDRMIVNVQIIYRPQSYGYPSEVFGVSIYSEKIK